MCKPALNGLNGNVVNRVFAIFALEPGGSFENTLSVPLKKGDFHFSLY